MGCHCDMVFQVEDSYIPDYRPNDATMNSDFVAVPQYECLRCGKRWGYLGMGTKLIEAPRILRVG